MKCVLHRYPKEQIKQTNASFTYFCDEFDILTFKKFARVDDKLKLLKSILWIFYAPLLVIGKGYDLIYCDDSFPFYALLCKLVSPKSKVVIRLGDLHLMYYFKGRILDFFLRIEKLEWDMVDMIIPISKSMTKFVNQRTRTKAVTILDPIDKTFFPVIKHEDNNTVMTHGLITRTKGIDVLLDAAKLLPDINFVIIGDGPDKQRLESLAPDNVTFIGWIPFNKMHLAINKCTVGVALRNNNPGNQYVITTAFLQYSVMGKPCLVTRRKVFKDMEYKWVFNGAEDLAKKIKILFNNPKEGFKTRGYILKNHEAKTIARKIKRCLKQVL